MQCQARRRTQPSGEQSCHPIRYEVNGSYVRTSDPAHDIDGVCDRRVF